ncbi:GRT1A protein, partial [Atractosteus spatula]|nr:GRT1A protein [Atractosteus spatula]
LVGVRGALSGASEVLRSLLQYLSQSLSPPAPRPPAEESRPPGGGHGHKPSASQAQKDNVKRPTAFQLLQSKSVFLRKVTSCKTKKKKKKKTKTKTKTMSVAVKRTGHAERIAAKLTQAELVRKIGCKVYNVSLCFNRIDPYGFERSEDFDYGSYEEFMSTYLQILTRRSIKWSWPSVTAMVCNQERCVCVCVLPVKRYVRKGIPNEHRSLIWMTASGAQEQMEKNPGYYRKLLEAEHDAKLVDTIKTDLNRTFPDNIQFRKTAEPCLQHALFNVLVAYGHHNKNVGYCQGMNFITGYLIIVTKDEEKSFWLLEALLGRILPDYYTPAMLGLKTDQEVLGELVRLKVPAVSQIMVQHNVMWTLVVSRWFICLFIDILPVETVLRIWDCMFYEGSKIIFRVALTLIKHNQALILQGKNFPDICDKFKEIIHGAFVEDCHTFMQVSLFASGKMASKDGKQADTLGLHHGLAVITPKRLSMAKQNPWSFVALAFWRVLLSCVCGGGSDKQGSLGAQLVMAVAQKADCDCSPWC